MADKKPEKNETPKEQSKEEPAKEDAKADASKEEDAQPKIGKKKIMIIAAAAIIVLIAGGATAFFMLSGSGGKQEAKIELPQPGPMTTYIFPKVLADLKTGLCRANYLSMSFMVEVGKNYTKSLQTHEVKLVEGVMLHLRSLERKDLVGKVGSDQLRVDIINIINAKIKPGRVEGVIFKEFILQ